MHTHDDLDLLAGGPKRAARRADTPSADVARSGEDGGPMSPASILALQRLAGNSTVSRLVASDDEQTAAAGLARSPVLDVVGRGGGQPLDPGLRREMEGSLGGDFGDVRIHTDAQASESARSVQANAYTVGQDVVFRSDQWAPGTDEGKRTLAHELTHVVQQSAGPVAGTETPGGIRLSDPGDEFERAAEATANAVMTGPLPPSVAGGSAARSSQRQSAGDEEAELQVSSIQRQGKEEELEEEELQASSIQRQGEEDEFEEEELPA